MNEEIQIEELAPWLVFLMTLIGGGMRVLLLDYKGMWVDETFSVWLASHSIADMLDWVIKIDQHPPLYYLLLNSWIARYGDTPYYARLLSVLFGAGTIPIIYLIGKRMSGEVVGLTAAVFLALSPYHIYFAQEARMYTLLTFNAAVAIYALVRLLTDVRAKKPIGSQFRDYLHAWRIAGPVEPEDEEEFSYKDKAINPTGLRGWIARHRWLPIQAISTDLTWIEFILFSAAIMFTHNTAVLFLLAINIFVLGLMLFQRANKSGTQPAFHAPSLGNWIKAQIAVLLLWSPWISAFVRQTRSVYQRFWIPEPTWEAVVQTFKSFLNAAAPMPISQAMVVWSLYALVLCLGVVYFRKRFLQFLFLAALFAVPFLGELLVSIRRPIFYDRTLIWITIPLFLVMAAGIAQLKFRFLVILAVGILGTINVFSVSDYFRFYQKEDWYTAAGYVANFAEEDDLVLFNSNFVEIPFNYYFKAYERLYGIQVVKQGVPADLIDDEILEPKMTDSDIPELISLLNGRTRVWLVYSHNWYTDPEGLIPQTLESEMELLRQRDFNGGQVQLYGIP
jgi:hypothetical protein